MVLGLDVNLSYFDADKTEFDGVLLISENLSKLNRLKLPSSLQSLNSILKNQQSVDKSFENQISVLSFQVSNDRLVPLVYSPTGPLNRDMDDVRRFYDAGLNGANRAVKAGVKNILLLMPEVEMVQYPLSRRVTILGILQAAYVPLEVREADANRMTKFNNIFIQQQTAGSDDVKILSALEYGRVVARDIGGSDPERTAAPKIEQYCLEIFANSSCVKMNVISDPQQLAAQYPLLEAVNRAAINVERHRGRVVWLEYEGGGDIDTTLMIVGKGITYDTGGADIKHGGAMAGMHRDKCGAAAVAGFFQFLNLYKPKGLKVIGAMCLVRNSVGSNSYVADEIITSRAGKRIRVKNTDAEGRMVMSDVLCECKERALKEKNPQLFTWATLTGHVIRVYGPNYFALCSNGPAKKAAIDQKLMETGNLCADPCEISNLRREDYKFHGPESEYEEVVQANCLPSTLTARGHQGPAAFMILASGLDKHGIDSDQPLCYTHCDVAGSSGPFPGVPTGSPLLAFAHTYVLGRQSLA